MSQKRKLGFVELYSKFCHDQTRGTTILVVMIQVIGPLTGEIVAQALELLCKRHPVLRSYLGESTEEYDYLEVDEEPRKLPLTVIRRSSAEQWGDVIEKNMLTLFAGSDRYLWRATLLEDRSDTSAEHELVIAFHHSISDGISVGSCLGELMDYCRLIVKGQKPSVESLPLFPAVEELLVKNVTQADQITKNSNDPSQGIEQLKDLYSFEETVPLEDRVTKNIYHYLNELELSALVDLCRDHKITLTSLLTAALMTAVSNVRGNKNVKREHGHVTYTPINLRDLCVPIVSQDQVGCFVSIVTTQHTVGSNTSLWELARSYNTSLREAITSLQIPIDFPKPILFDMLATLKDGVAKEVFNYGVGITNIGRLNFTADFTPFQIRKFHFCTARHWGDWLMLVHTSTLDNNLFICCTYENPLLSDKTAKGITDGFISILQSQIMKRVS